MNQKNIIIIWVLTLFLLGCKQNSQAPEEAVIDKEKITKMFDRNPNNVLFNHLYVVLDSMTYDQLLKNDFMNESYAGLDKGMPKFESINDSVTSIYLRGETHYLEILGPNNNYKEPIGQNGLGFSLGEGELFSIDKVPKLKEEGTEFLRSSDSASFKINNKELTWYKAFYTMGAKTNLYTWYSYYNPEFLEAIDSTKQESYSRTVFLKKGYASDKLFKNVVSIVLSCNTTDQYRIAKELQLLGCSLDKKEGKDLTFKAGDIYIKLALAPDSDLSKIVQIETTLNREDNRTIEFEKMTITTKGKTSLWTFR